MALDPSNLLIMLLVAIVAGIFGSLLGLGGGVIMVPFLTLALKVPIHIAIAASIVAVVATSSAAATVYVREGAANIRLGMLLEVGAASGAMLGALLATMLDRDILSLLFGAILVYTSLYMMKYGGEGQEVWRGQPSPGPPNGLRLRGKYYDAASDSHVYYDVSKVRGGMAMSFIAGNFSGMLGVGGGVIHVPMMRYLMMVPIKVATATSSFMMGVAGAVGAYIYYSRGLVDPLITAPTVLGIFIGAQIGPRLAHKVRGATIRSVFTAILLYIAARMLLAGAGVSIPF